MRGVVGCLVVLVAACGDAAPAYETVLETRAVAKTQLDVLVLVDDSAAVFLDYQYSLGAAGPSLFEPLAGLDLKLGVISPDMGTNGAPAISGGGPGSCEGDGKNAEVLATTPATFAADVLRGANSCGFEQPLAAISKALDDGFHRADAQLAVVIVMDEDDCSFHDPAFLGPESATLGPLQSFRCTRFGVTCSGGGATPDAMATAGTKTGCSASVGSPYLDDLAPYIDRLDDDAVVTLFAAPSDAEVVVQGPPSNSTPALQTVCPAQGPMGLIGADPAVRLHDFARAFPNHTTHAICELDYAPALAETAYLAERAMGRVACVETALPEPRDCIVEDVLPDGTATRLARFTLAADPTACPRADHLRLTVEREAPADAAATTRVRCRVE